MECPKAMTNTVCIVVEMQPQSITRLHMYSLVSLLCCPISTDTGCSRSCIMNCSESLFENPWHCVNLFVSFHCSYCLIRSYQNAVNVTVQLWTTGNECSCDRQVGMPSIGVSPLLTCAGLVWLSMTLFKRLLLWSPQINCKAGFSLAVTLHNSSTGMGTKTQY